MIKGIRLLIVALLGGGVSSVAAPSAIGSIFQTASPYTDTQGDHVGSSNKDREIWSATVTNDATNLIITINLDPGANLASGGAFNYGIGFTTGDPNAGGDLAGDSTNHGNPYKANIAIDSTLGGMMDWIGIFGTGGNGSAGTPYTGYAYNDYTYGTPGSSQPANTWTRVSAASVPNVTMSMQAGQTTFDTLTATVPMSDFSSNLPMTAGTTIDFDIYTTGSPASGQTAYDSLADQTATTTGNSTTAQYTGTVLDSYTIQQVPEPAALGVLALGGFGLMKRRAQK
jgi:hypothetical protein